MRILFFGDVVGRPGLNALTSLLPSLRDSYGADFVIVNGENASSNGRGLTEREYEALLAGGADCVTLGNHWRGKDEIDDWINEASNLVRPLNLIGYAKGAGSQLFDVDGTPLRVTNLLGAAFLKEMVNSPYSAMDALLEKEEDALHVVDFHAESTSEKETLAYYLDGRVSAVLGTHTHVQTNDPRILPHGTGYLSDVGYCGLYESVIGFSPEAAIRKTVQGEKIPFQIPKEGKCILDFALLDLDEANGECLRVKPVSLIGGKERDGEAGI